MWMYFTAKNTVHYLDVLPELVSSYNSTYHRIIKMAPNQVSLLNVGLVRRNLYGNVKSKVKFKFRVGDRKSRRTNLRRDIYLTGQRRSSFTICKRVTKEHPIYKLTDDSEDTSCGEYFSVCKQKRGRDTFLLVKWKGCPEMFSSWVNEKDVKNLQKEYQSSHWPFSQTWTKHRRLI